MNRRNLFIALFGIGAAQAQSVYDQKRDCVVPQWSGTCPARNRECPVCGTTAPKYHSEKTAAMACAGPSDKEDGLMVCRSVEVDAEPERVVRCKTCNAAFFVDAE